MEQQQIEMPLRAVALLEWNNIDSFGLRYIWVALGGMNSSN